MFSDSILYNLVTNNHIENTSDLPVWVIGDVHGCFDQLNELIYRIRFYHGSKCIIIQLGDLIDRGPSILEIFELINKEKIITCVGNHELNFTQEYFGYKSCRSKARLRTHDKFKELDTFQQEFIINQMLKMKNYVTIDVGGDIWTVSHAPIKSEIDIFHDCGAANIYCMGKLPYNKIELDAKCVHGHMHWLYRDISEQIKDPDQGWYNIDSGCVYGGELIALELKTLEVIRVSGVDYASDSN